ncbi:MAG: NusG domain II-containing protein [Eubacteriales bacterium]|nr:NusG domain II-containing protein [Eubacteriales bacterium]MDD3349976.1 NusG domain II-containing protein [Eubacteriales bacterium]
MNFFKKTDLLIIATILIVSALSFGIYQLFLGGSAARAEIYYEGELVESIRLERGEEKEFSVPEAPSVVFHLWPDCTISFSQSDCPDQVCVHAGRIGTVGEFAACLPNKLVLKIVSDGKDEKEAPDIVIGN